MLARLGKVMDLSPSQQGSTMPPTGWRSAAAVALRPWAHASQLEWCGDGRRGEAVAACISMHRQGLR